MAEIITAAIGVAVEAGWKIYQLWQLGQKDPTLMSAEERRAEIAKILETQLEDEREEIAIATGANE